MVSTRYLTLAASILVALASWVAAQDMAAGSTEVWEMRVCADPNSPPFSSLDRTGFENRLAEILADELGAIVTFEWYPQGSAMIRDRLRAGACDVVMGIPDGYEAVLNTVAYYRSPYVFAYPQDAPFEVDSLDDPILADLRIGVQSGGIPPHEALLSRGLIESIEYLGRRPGGEGSSDAVLEAVAEGRIDLAIAWGPVAGFWDQRNPGVLTLEPVTPSFDPLLLGMSFPMTVGVRVGDTSFRDRLDVAIAARWDQIQELLSEYGVPREPLPAPVATLSDTGVADRVLPLGLVVPTRTGGTIIPTSILDLVGEGARQGALQAEDDVAAATGRAGRPVAPGDDAGARGPVGANHIALDPAAVDVLVASAPTAEAASRAASRLLHVEGVVALIGGIGEGQADALADAATKADVPFMNIGSTEMALRTCTGTTFHLQASDAQYLDAIVSWFHRDGNDRWFVVHSDDPRGRSLRTLAVAAIEGESRDGSGTPPGAPAEVVGSAPVSPGQPSYAAELEMLASADADVVLVLLGARDQIPFLAQKAMAGSNAAVAAFPEPITQTRDYLATLRHRAGTLGLGPRPALWDTGLAQGDAGSLNERYMSRWGQPMDPSAWAAYQAVSMLADAASAADSYEGSSLARALLASEQLDVAKATPAAFRDGDRQLLQDVYLVEVDPDQPWSRSLTDVLGLGEVIGVRFAGPGSFTATGCGSEAR